MLCPRCRGLLVRETFGELREEAERMYSATRCINCGSIEDSVVRANRLSLPAAKRPERCRIVGRTDGAFLGSRAEVNGSAG